MIKQRKVDVAEGNASPTQDMLSQMLLTWDEDGSYQKESEIAVKILGMLVTGFDTVSAALTFIVKYLADFPRIYDAVYKEQTEIVNSKTIGKPLKWEDLQKMKYSWNVAQEVTRMTPPVQGNFREALTDFVYHGFTIPKGWKLFFGVQTGHTRTPIVSLSRRSLTRQDSKERDQHLTHLFHLVEDLECVQGISTLG